MSVVTATLMSITYVIEPFTNAMRTNVRMADVTQGQSLMLRGCPQKS